MIGLERIVPADRASLWSVVSDLDRWDEMLPTVDEVTRVGPPGPIRVGTRFRVRQPGLAEAEYEVTDWRPGAGFTWVATVNGVRTTATHSLKARGDATLLTLGVDWTGRGAWLVRMLFTRKTRSFLDREAQVFGRLAATAGRAR